jgi:hypothetical protein
MIEHQLLTLWRGATSAALFWVVVVIQMLMHHLAHMGYCGFALQTQSAADPPWWL